MELLRTTLAHLVECITLPILVTVEICQVRGTWKKVITATEEGEAIQAGVEVEVDETSAPLAEEVVVVVVATITITLISKTTQATRISKVK